MTFELQRGKKYQRRDGDGPVEIITHSDGLFFTRDYRVGPFYPNGRKTLFEERQEDLVAEWHFLAPAQDDFDADILATMDEYPDFDADLAAMDEYRDPYHGHPQKADAPAPGPNPLHALLLDKPKEAEICPQCGASEDTRCPADKGRACFYVRLERYATAGEDKPDTPRREPRYSPDPDATAPDTVCPQCGALDNGCRRDSREPDCYYDRAAGRAAMDEYKPDTNPLRALLDEAAETIAARGAPYGGVEDNFERIARLWSGHLVNRYGAVSFLLDPTDVAVMMVLLKIARLANNPAHRDSWVDIAGYAACGGSLSKT